MYQRMRRALAITSLIVVLLGLSVFAAAESSVGAAYLAGTALAAMRWLVLLGMVIFACFRPSLTSWIFISMLLGAEIGHDFPAFGVSLRLLAQIFLRLIKVIIAPLLFSTLVSGIAGHSDLKKVGRMGVKALIFFEVVTTLALFIGLAAINISQAGVGAQIPANTAETVKI
jgi:proton glutamate symport protein